MLLSVVIVLSSAIVMAIVLSLAVCVVQQPTRRHRRLIEQAIENALSAPRRRAPKVIDCTLLNDELDMLKYRLSILDKVVDTFVIVESRYTFTNKPKKLSLEANWDQFERWRDRIVYLVIDKFPTTCRSASHRDHYQRNFASTWLTANCEPYDIVLASDCDEIVNPDVMEVAKALVSIHGALYFDVREFYYSFKWETKVNSLVARLRPTGKPVGCLVSLLKTEKINYLRYKLGKLGAHAIKKGGWHLSYFMSKDKAHKKLLSFAHTELSGMSASEVANRMDAGRDMAGRWYFKLIRSTSTDGFPPRACETWGC